MSGAGIPFDYGDAVEVDAAAPAAQLPGSVGEIVGIIEADRTGEFLAAFPHGRVCEVEIGDGSTFIVEERYLRHCTAGSEPGQP
ncbi:hypothetical protein [Elioraea sp.]|uniref:hypothetical protein n=1 Tax=Elioraea sp. TaxID=2185103 RepID=UPI0025BFD617|nr:hypothetical protein [Elioraea sp.]